MLIPVFGSCKYGAWKRPVKAKSLSLLREPRAQGTRRWRRPSALRVSRTGRTKGLPSKPQRVMTCSWFLVLAGNASADRAPLCRKKRDLWG